MKKTQHSYNSASYTNYSTESNLCQVYNRPYKKHKTNYGTAFTEGYNIGYKKGYADATNNKLELV